MVILVLFPAGSNQIVSTTFGPYVVTVYSPRAVFITLAPIPFSSAGLIYFSVAAKGISIYLSKIGTLTFIFIFLVGLSSFFFQYSSFQCRNAIDFISVKLC